MAKDNSNTVSFDVVRSYIEAGKVSIDGEVVTKDSLRKGGMALMLRVRECVSAMEAAYDSTSEKTSRKPRESRNLVIVMVDSEGTSSVLDECEYSKRLVREEKVTAARDLAAFSGGRILLFVEGKDIDGNSTVEFQGTMGDLLDALR